jgi:nucleoside-diphosphate-sugar epimerase
MDVARWVIEGTPIDIRTGVANCIWQGDAISHILRSLVHGTTPARPINIGAPQTTSIRQAAIRFGEIFGREPVFINNEESTAWHNDCSEARDLFGDPHIDLETMIRWNADWLQRGMPLHNKPTHYEERAGAF